LRRACFIALQLGLGYLWSDTCCIDKNDEEDTAKNIKAMFDFYQNSAVCLVYLFDFPDAVSSIAFSEWFNRGWTLQELVAPDNLFFFDREWKFLGTNQELKPMIHMVTGIDQGVIEGERHINEVHVRERIGWARGRKTTVPQDMAFCLIGILGIKELEPDYTTPVEGAFERLQEELIRVHPSLETLIPDGLLMFLVGLEVNSPFRK
jgi:hypothetical protein